MNDIGISSVNVSIIWGDDAPMLIKRQVGFV